MIRSQINPANPRDDLVKRLETLNSKIKPCEQFFDLVGCAMIGAVEDYIKSGRKGSQGEDARLMTLVHALISWGEPYLGPGDLVLESYPSLALENLKSRFTNFLEEGKKIYG